MDAPAIINLLLLTLVQSITEFFPVSSSAHLIIISNLFQDQYQLSLQGLSLHILLHMGSASAIIVYFFQDWKKYFVSFFSNAKKHQLQVKHWDQDGKMLLNLSIATLPAVVIGFFFYDFIAENLRNVYVVSSALTIGAIILFFADKLHQQTSRSEINSLNFQSYLLLGFVQALAFIPGVSRSGIIISMALLLKFDKNASIKIAFLMSCPVIIGATTHELLFNFDSLIFENFLVATLCYLFAFFSSLIVIRLLLSYINKYSFSIFVIYRIMMSLILIFFLA
jgi:undecaprenyl-diphosphatase